MATAAKLMTKDVIRVTPDRPIADVADTLLRHRLSAVPVVDATGHLVGIVSEGDLVRCAKKQRAANRSWWLGLLTPGKAIDLDHLDDRDRTAGEVMSRDVLVAREDETLPHLIKLLANSRIKRVPIVTHGRLVGIVSRVDVLRHLDETAGRTGRIT